MTWARSGRDVARKSPRISHSERMTDRSDIGAFRVANDPPEVLAYLIRWRVILRALVPLFVGGPGNATQTRSK